MEKRTFSIGSNTYKLNTNDTQEYIDSIAQKIVDNYNEYSRISKFTEREKYIFTCFNLADKSTKFQTELKKLQEDSNKEIGDVASKIADLENDNAMLSSKILEKEDKITNLVKEFEIAKNSLDSFKSEFSEALKEKDEIIAFHNEEKGNLLVKYREEKEQLLRDFQEKREQLQEEKKQTQVDKDKKLAEAIDKISKFDSERETAVTKVREEYRNLIADKDSKVQSARDRISAINMTKEEEINKIKTKYINIIAEKDMEIEETKKVLECMGNNSSEMDVMQEKNEKLIDEKESYFCDLQSANNEKENLKLIITDLNERLNKMDIDLKEKNGELFMIRAENKEIIGLLEEATK